MWYGQIVIGPPGSGKSSYCFGMQQLLQALQRQHIVVNLDPMNDSLPYECAVDVMELIKGEDVMKNLQLGPNGAMIYCMEFLLENIDWLVEKLKAYKNYYVLIDCPGQVELFTHHDALRTIIRHLEKLDFRVSSSSNSNSSNNSSSTSDSNSTTSSSSSRRGRPESSERVFCSLCAADDGDSSSGQHAVHGRIQSEKQQQQQQQQRQQ
ncbi:Whole genome shotgun assembly, allelic scaffold old set, scaffold old scaffoldA_149, related [Eimeria acervulina]|uniref:GPN-loop GTPase 2 n=1 Tax=Eimeria acervulina TaxID=5801 RepID=U6G9Y0_EIMAC|nr:Whole genome shotgun assembly, allelic scaffold old set, scaffold old scaffoldA_149, related [Eimeria acervulina]CDI76133.1 Whole genome shotgun assembly, allelic scaffold old set, scaffold old scaffoldA_149, related [Eimeria acervulina]